MNYKTRNLFFKLLLMMFLILLCFFGCKNPSNSSSSSEKTKLTISVAGGSKTIMPASVSIASYTLTGVRTSPSVESYGQITSADGTFTITNMDNGIWTITVQALNSSGVVLAQGSGSVTLAGQAVVTTIDLTIQNTLGSGSVAIDLSWPSSLAVTSLTGVLTPVDSSTNNGTTVALSANILTTTTATLSNAAVPVGSYLLSIYCNSSTTANLSDAVLVYKDQTSSGSLILNNTDGLGLTIDNCTISTLTNDITGPESSCTDGTYLYVSDWFNHEVKKVEIATGTVTIIAGQGTAGHLDGYGTAAIFNGPAGICLVNNNLFVVEAGGNEIRKIDLSNDYVSTLTGSYGSYGSINGIGTAATFYNPEGICSDGTNLYVADYGNNMIRKIVIATVAVSTFASSSTFYHAMGICTDGINLYVTDYDENIIKKILISSEAVTTFAGQADAGSADGLLMTNSFNLPRGICTDGSFLYINDGGNSEIRKINISTGLVSTIAGTTSSGYVNSTGALARFSTQLFGITTDGTNLYVSDYGNSAIRKISKN